VETATVYAFGGTGALGQWSLLYKRGATAIFFCPQNTLPASSSSKNARLHFVYSRLSLPPRRWVCSGRNDWHAPARQGYDQVLGRSRCCLRQRDSCSDVSVWLHRSVHESHQCTAMTVITPMPRNGPGQTFSGPTYVWQGPISAWMRGKVRVTVCYFSNEPTAHDVHLQSVKFAMVLR
jgi:hypothetical protein